MVTSPRLFNASSLLHQDISLRVCPSVADDEEVCLDEADLRLANQEGSTTDIVEDADD